MSEELRDDTEIKETDIVFVWPELRVANIDTIANAIEKLRNYVDLGCKGFGEVNHQSTIDDRRILPYYKVCGDLGIPVLIHIEPYPINKDLDGFMRVLREFPETNFIAHGPCWWDHISKEVPTGGYNGIYPPGSIQVSNSRTPTSKSLTMKWSIFLNVS